MASVFNRGTRAAPRWFAKFRGADGRDRVKRIPQTKRGDAQKVADALADQATRVRLGIEAPAGVETDPLCGPLLERWMAGDVVNPGELRQWSGLSSNRGAQDDAHRARLHLVPRFRKVRLSELTPRYLQRWLEEMRAAGKLSGTTQRHLLGVLGRFFEWAVTFEHAAVNPVRSIPRSARPKASPRNPDAPWLKDDAVVTRLLRVLPSPFREMFFLGISSGLRTGELCGLRLADLAHIAEGGLLVSRSYGKGLKEDRGTGKSKWVPAPIDWNEVLGAWLDRRRAEGAGDLDLVFPRPSDGRMMSKTDVFHPWASARKAVGLTLSWYAATRHSFASRALSRGASLDEVSAALGHSSPAITKKHYAHFVRTTTWSPQLRGLGIAPAKPRARTRAAA